MCDQICSKEMKTKSLMKSTCPNIGQYNFFSSGIPGNKWLRLFLPQFVCLNVIIFKSHLKFEMNPTRCHQNLLTTRQINCVNRKFLFYVLVASFVRALYDFKMVCLFYFLFYLIELNSLRISLFVFEFDRIELYEIYSVDENLVFPIELQELWSCR